LLDLRHFRVERKGRRKAQAPRWIERGLEPLGAMARGVGRESKGMLELAGLLRLPLQVGHGQHGSDTIVIGFAPEIGDSVSQRCRGAGVARCKHALISTAVISSAISNHWHPYSAARSAMQQFSQPLCHRIRRKERACARAAPPSPQLFNAWANLAV